jgi:hypothetical protein
MRSGADDYNAADWQEPKPKRKDIEHQEQCIIVKHVMLRKRPHVYWYAVPNGGNRPTKTNKRTGRKYSPDGARLKKEGVRAGVQDLHFLVGGQECKGCGETVHGLPIYIEYKPDGGVLSKVQRDMRDEVIAAGGIWYVAHGIDEALGILERHGVIK